MPNHRIEPESNPALATAVDWLYSDLKTLNPEIFSARIHPDTALLERVRANWEIAAAMQPELTLHIPLVTGVNYRLDAQGELLDSCVSLLTRRPNGKLKIELLRQHHLANPQYAALGRINPTESTPPPERRNLEQFAMRLRHYDLDVTIFW